MKGKNKKGDWQFLVPYPFYNQATNNIKDRKPRPVNILMDNDARRQPDLLIYAWSQPPVGPKAQ